MAPNEKTIAESGNVMVTAEKEKQEPFKAKIVWINVAFFLALHLAAIYGFFDYFLNLSLTKIKTGFFAFTVGYLSGYGITMGAHRLWAHRSFKAKLPVRLALLLGQTIAGQNSVWVWVRDHRLHHKYSETVADPHDSNRGFFFSHIGWLLMQKHPEVIRKGRLLDMTDMNADPLVMFQKKYYNILYLVFAMFLPVFIPIYFWNESFKISFLACYCFRYAASLNITWSVNSVAHMFGNRPYDKNIQPVETAYVSFFANGEGWHNYHHTFPWDCEASEFGKQFNTTSKIIRKLEKIGLVYDCKRATKEMVIHRVQKHGDGSHPIY